jgi:hypothetical protein
MPLSTSCVNLGLKSYAPSILAKNEYTPASGTPSFIGLRLTPQRGDKTPKQ